MDCAVLWARAIVVGSLAFFLGVAGHVTADGLLPGPLFCGALLALSILLSIPMLSRPASSLRLVTLLVGGQTLIHVAMSVTGGHAGDPTVEDAARSRPTTGPEPLPLVDGRRVGSLQDAYEGGADSALAPTLPVGHLVADLSAHAPMMAAHLAAAALVGLWLAYGERCLWSIIALTRRAIVVAATLLAPIVPLPSRRSTTALTQMTVRPQPLWLVRPDSRRGPPLLAA